jgi:Ran GTPase-activating protein (RanGAP) involved in mRNA processing and transport
MVPWGYIPPQSLHGSGDADTAVDVSPVSQLSRQARLDARLQGRDKQLAPKKQQQQQTRKPKRRSSPAPRKQQQLAPVSGRSGGAARQLGVADGSSRSSRPRGSRRRADHRGGRSTQHNARPLLGPKPAPEPEPETVRVFKPRQEPEPEPEPEPELETKPPFERAGCSASDSSSEHSDRGRSEAVAPPPPSPAELCVLNLSGIAAAHAYDGATIDPERLPDLDSDQGEKHGAAKAAPAVLSPHLKTWSISRPYSAPPEKQRQRTRSAMRARLGHEVEMGADERRERQREQLCLGFDADMEADEMAEFFELFKWRRERQLEGESAPVTLGLKCTPRGSVALPDGVPKELTPRRAYLDACCRSSVAPVPLVRNCVRPRPVVRTGSASRTTRWRRNSPLVGGGMLAVDGVAHLDLSNRLVEEQAWGTTRHGDGSHPDTLWSASAPSRSRVGILAQTLRDHTMNLQSLDASNNQFVLSNDSSAYTERAEQVLRGGMRHAVGVVPTASARPPSPTYSGPVTTQEAPMPRSRQLRARPRTAGSSRAPATRPFDLPAQESAHFLLSLRTQRQLTTVDLSNNRIGAKGARCLAEVLAQPTCRIKNLILAGNRFGDAAVEALAGTIDKLSVVNLRDCAIGDSGAIAIADYMTHSKCGEVLDLSWNHIRARGGIALASCLAVNRSITDLDLAWNGLGDVELEPNERGKVEPLQLGATEIGGAIAKNTTLKRLDISHNRIAEQGAFVIADGMGRNKTLMQLSMDGNPVGGTGGRELLRAMRELRGLREISLKGCCMKTSDQKLMVFDATQPAGDYVLDLSKQYDRAVASQLIKVVRNSGGRDRWHELQLAMRYRGDDKLRETGCRYAKCRGGCHYCMKPAYWSPERSVFSSTPAADFSKEAPDEKCIHNVDPDGNKQKLPEICSMIEVLLNAGHTSECPQAEHAAVVQPCTECQGWQSAWGALSEWLSDDGQPKESLKITFKHIHTHRPPTEEDVVSHTGLSKLKKVIRDARAGSQQQQGTQASNAIEQAAAATAKARKLAAAVMKIQRQADEEANPLQRIAMQAMAKKEMAKVKAENKKAEEMLQRANSLEASSTTEDEKKQQRAILDMTAKEFHFKAEQVDELLELFADQHSKAQVIVKLFERTLDTDALLEIVASKLEAQEQKWVEQQLGELYRFDKNNPTGHYRLDLGKAFDRLLAMKLLALSNAENEERMESGLIDTSQRMNRYNFRNQRIDGRRVGKKFDAELPESGVFEFDYTSTFINGFPRSLAAVRLMQPDAFDLLVKDTISVLKTHSSVQAKATEIRKLIKGRFFTCKQLCRILYSAKMIPAFCYCWYCWKNIDLVGKSTDYRPFEATPGMANTQVKGYASQVFLPCQHMICCSECAQSITRKYHKCLYCAKTIEEVVEPGNKRIKKEDFGRRRVLREFAKLDVDGSGSLDRDEVTTVILDMLGSKTQQEDIDLALRKMDQDGSGEVEQEEFANWWRSEHADEHPSGPDVDVVHARIMELRRRGALPSRHAGNRELLLELAVMFFGRAVDLLQFKHVINFFSHEERTSLYLRLGPLNALNPLDPDGKWYLNLKTADERYICDMLVKLAVGEPGENWLGEQFGDTAPTRPAPNWGQVKMRSFDLPMPWLTNIPSRGLLELTYFTSAKSVDVDLRRSLIPKCLVSEEIHDLSSLADPFDLLSRIKATKAKKPQPKAGKSSHFTNAIKR